MIHSVAVTDGQTDRKKKHLLANGQTFLCQMSVCIKNKYLSAEMSL